VIVRYLNYQDKFDVLNGKPIDRKEQLAELLHRRRNQRPFVAELSGDNGFQIVFGISTDLCFAEHRRINGDLPYLMAVSPDPPRKQGDVEFYAANTPTPIPARNIIRFDELKQIALHFLETGERSDAVLWEPL
jgi:Immunity protein Imm1